MNNSNLEELNKRIDEIELLINLFFDGKSEKNNLAKHIDDFSSLSGSLGEEFLFQASCQLSDLLLQDAPKERFSKIVDLIKNFNSAIEKEELGPSSDTIPRVLIIEKNQKVVENMMEIFKGLNLNISITNDSEKGLKRFLRESFDLIIVDYASGIMDGLDFIGTIKSLRNRPSSKTILLASEQFNVIKRSMLPDFIVHKDEFLIKRLKDIFEGEALFQNEKDKKEHLIYCLDDDQEILSLLKKSFSKFENIKADFFSRKELLLSSMKDERPSLILLDLILEDESGIDIINEIHSKKEFRDIPVIFLSARDQDFDGAIIKNTDAIGWIQKPFNVKSLWKDISKLIS